MRKEDWEIIGLTSEKFILSFFDIAVAPFFTASPIYRQSMKKLDEESSYDRSVVNERIKYLKRIKYVRVCVEGKEKYLELLPKGVKKLEKIVLDNLAIARPKKWDQKWRVAIFDVPEKQSYSRDLFRKKLVEMGFIQIQKSVYIYPFPCTDEIAYLSQKLGLECYITIMISEIIQGEEDVIDQFMQKGVLHKGDLKSQ